MPHERTPGPWVADTGGMDAYVVCPDGRRFLVGDLLYHEENRTNARFIALACNSHDALLAACRQARAAFHATDLAPAAGDAMDALEAAIAQAEGGGYAR